MNPGIAAQRTEQVVKEAWLNVAHALYTSSDPQDRELARKINEFTSRMQTVSRVAYLAQKRSTKLERER